MAIRNLLTTNEVAEILQVSPRTLQTWRAKHPNELPFIRVGGQIRYREDDVEDFLDEYDED